MLFVCSDRTRTDSSGVFVDVFCDGNNPVFLRVDNAQVGVFALLLAYGLIWLVAAITLGVRTPAPDWEAFYATGRAVLDGTPWYATAAGRVPNLAPPLVAPIFAGLSILPIRIAFLVWTTAWLVAALWVVRRAARVWQKPTWQMIAVLFACHGMPIGVALGQLHLAVFVLVTVAWLTDREDRPLAAGAWLGVAIYLKPFFALVVAYWLWRRAWQAASVAAVVVVGGYLVGLLWLPDATAGWLEALSSVTWQHANVNLAVWGWIARLDLSVLLAIGLAALVIGLLLWRLGALSRDGAWFAVVIAACLISPIAWLYYALPIVGPMGVVYQQGDGRTKRLLQIGYIGLCAPLTFQESAVADGGLLAATLGSWYLWAFLCLWLAALRVTVKIGPS